MLHEREAEGCAVLRGDGAEGEMKWLAGDEDLAAAELSNQHLVAMCAEVTGGERQPPRCIEPKAMLEAIQQLAAWREDIDESLTGSVYFIFLSCVLLGVRDVQISADVLHIEWSIALR